MKIKKQTFYTILTIILIAIVLIVIYSINQHNKDKYTFSENTFSYSQDRGSPKYEISFLSENETYETYKVNFYSRNFLNYTTYIYGLLLMPKGKTNVPGLVLLPGGAVPKENEVHLGGKIADLGYAVLTFDQRGIGQTGGYYLSFEDDYKVFSQGDEPVQHLSVYDALKAYDVLREMKNVDKDNIAIAGESMGGRYAIIAAALDKRIKGALIISSSGFHIQNDNKPYTPFLQSIDPDTYIDKISPNPIFMLHSTNDAVIKLEDAKATFNLAKEPKKLFTVDNCPHGYCDKMYDEMKSDLKTIFGE